MKLKITSEDCCEVCNEVIHNHFDCPACKLVHAGTNAYTTVSEHLTYNDTLDCESCGAKFKLVKGKASSNNAEWEQVV